MGLAGAGIDGAGCSCCSCSPLEEGDVEEELSAAEAIGDDRIQRQARGYVVPESFMHGSSAQRVEWLKRGLRLGDIQQCDTFGGMLR